LWLGAFASKGAFRATAEVCRKGHQPVDAWQRSAASMLWIGFLVSPNAIMVVSLLFVS